MSGRRVTWRGSRDPQPSGCRSKAASADAATISTISSLVDYTGQRLSIRSSSDLGVGSTLMPRKSKNIGSRATRLDAPLDTFDDEGVRLAMLAALEAVYELFPHITLPQYLISLEVRKAEREGSPHTLASIVKKLKMPFSTVSRVVWSLTAEGGDIGIVRYLNHPTDRRKKLLVINERNEPDEIPRAISRAMLAYYGEAVRQLRGSS